MGKGKKLFRGKGGEVILDEDATQMSSEDEQPTEDVVAEEEDSQVLEFSSEVIIPSSQAEERSGSPAIEVPRKRAKFERKNPPLTEAEEVKLAEWYQENEFFYNKRINSYRDKQRKIKAWSKQAEVMGKPVEVLENWIINMRTRYAKLIDEKSGMAVKDMTQRDQWIHATFTFLRPHIVRCPTRTSKVNIFSKVIVLFKHNRITFNMDVFLCVGLIALLK